MDKLQELRSQIDNIDENIVQLYEKRLRLVEGVAEYKKLNNAEVLQQNRENDVIEKAVEHLSDSTYAPQVVSLMTSIMDISKDLQRQKIDKLPTFDYQRKAFDKSAKVGYYGQKASNSWEAMNSIFGKNANCQCYDQFEQIFVAMKNNEIEYGVVPIENSYTGAIDEVYDLLGKYDLYIVAEKWQRISHQLYSLSGDINQIKKVYSHPQPLSQCDMYLADKQWELCPFSSTSASAKLVAESNDSSLAAIANVSSGELYGLKLVAENIHTNKENWTRFIVISRVLTTDTNNKISIQFNLTSTAGALFNVLKYFAKFGINMVKIESRPVKNNPCNYYFFIDLEGACNDNNMAIALHYIKQNSNYFKFLGEYSKDNFV